MEKARGYYEGGRWIPGDKWEVVNAHWWRSCHPETCVCRTDYVVLKNGFFFADATSEEDGQKTIKYEIETKSALEKYFAGSTYEKTSYSSK